MILPDTSVWIEYFRLHEPYFSHIKHLADRAQLVTNEFIIGELLQGARNRNELDFLLDYFENIPRPREQKIIIEAGILSFENSFSKKGVGLIDAVLLVCTQKNKYKLWTLDKRLSALLSSQERYIP